MKLLIDTHIILWALDDNPRLPVRAREMILDGQNEIYYSVASIWETSIKYMAKPDKTVSYTHLRAHETSV